MRASATAACFVLLTATCLLAQASSVPPIPRQEQFRPAAAQFGERDADHQQRVAAVRRQLQSSDPKEVALGGFIAASYQLREVGPQLVQALGAAPSGGRREAVISALLDAIVQTGAAVPAARLEPFWEEWPVQTLAAFRNATGARDPILLRRLASRNGYQWFAAANQLLESRSPGFASAVLMTLRFRFQVAVVNPGTDAMPSTGPEIIPWEGTSPEVKTRVAGYPPFVEYRFERVSAFEHERAPRAVHYIRYVHDETQFSIDSYSTAGPSNTDRLQYLVALTAGRLDPSRERAWEGLYIHWQDANDFRKRATEGLREVDLRYRALLESLVASGALTTMEAEPFREPARSIEVLDYRSEPRSPLPPWP